MERAVRGELTKTPFASLPEGLAGIDIVFAFRGRRNQARGFTAGGEYDRDCWPRPNHRRKASVAGRWSEKKPTTYCKGRYPK